MMKIKQGVCNRKNGFIVPCLTYLFTLFEKISIFYFIRSIGSKVDEKKGNNETDNKCFVQMGVFSEIWVLGNIIWAIFAQNVIKYTGIKWFSIICMIYAIERIWEMFVYQVNVLFFHRLKDKVLEVEQIKEKQNDKTSEPYLIISATRTVILLIFNMAEYILHFAVIYAAAVNLGWIDSVESGVWQSFQIFMSMGDLQQYSDSKVLAFTYIETIVGIFMNVACLAYFIGMLPATKSKLQVEIESQKDNE
jgi:hypothetical protein